MDTLGAVMGLKFSLSVNRASIALIKRINLDFSIFKLTPSALVESEERND